MEISACFWRCKELQQGLLINHTGKLVRYSQPQFIGRKIIGKCENTQHHLYKRNGKRPVAHLIQKLPLLCLYSRMVYKNDQDSKYISQAAVYKLYGQQVVKIPPSFISGINFPLMLGQVMADFAACVPAIKAP